MGLSGFEEGEFWWNLKRVNCLYWILLLFCPWLLAGIMYLYMTCICLYTVLCCKEAERSRIDKQIREVEINSPDGTDSSPNLNAQRHMVIDEEQYNRNPALYGKHPHQRAMSYEDY